MEGGEGSEADEEDEEEGEEAVPRGFMVCYACKENGEPNFVKSRDSFSDKAPTPTPPSPPARSARPTRPEPCVCARCLAPRSWPLSVASRSLRGELTPKLYPYRRTYTHTRTAPPPHPRTHAPTPGQGGKLRQGNAAFLPAALDRRPARLGAPSTLTSPCIIVPSYIPLGVAAPLLRCFLRPLATVPLLLPSPPRPSPPLLGSQAHAPRRARDERHGRRG